MTRISQQNISRFFSTRRDILILITVTTALTLLSLIWLGYDLSLLPRAIIGDYQVTHYTLWTINQALNNILHRLPDLGYAPIFYGEPSPFALTIAPYGVAITILPVYFLAGKNIILAYNLAWIASFPFTACASYLLIRHQLKTLPSVAAFASLIITFAPFRFWHSIQIETLFATGFVVFTLYFLHRLIEDPEIKWAVWLLLCFWILLLSSIYLALITLVAGGIILLGVAVWQRQLITRRLILSFAGICLIGILIGGPFISYRFNNPTLVQGHSEAGAKAGSATVFEWFNTFSQVYHPFPVQSPHALFPGFTVLALSWVGFTYWHTGKPEEKQRTITLPLYIAIGFVGFLLSFGPNIRITQNFSIPSPYLLLVNIPGFASVRSVWIFSFSVVIASGVISAFGLHALSQRLSRRKFITVLLIATIGLVVEYMPYDGGGSGSLFKPALPQDKRLVSTVWESEIPVNIWLSQQPPGTPIVHFPIVFNNLQEILNDQRFHNQPMLNGRGSLFPGWYKAAIRYDPFSPAMIQLLYEHEIEYILVHRDWMTQEEYTAFTKQQEAYYESEKTTFPLIREFENVDVYALP